MLVVSVAVSIAVFIYYRPILFNCKLFLIVIVLSSFLANSSKVTLRKAVV